MRVVFDTNAVVSAILFTRGRLAWLRDLWTEGRVVPLSSRETLEELVRVLAYPKFGLSEADIEILLGSYIPHAEVVRLERLPAFAVPRCSDPADQVFLALASAGKAEVLVTGDRALIQLAGRTAFAIETPARFRERFA